MKAIIQAISCFLCCLLTMLTLCSCQTEAANNNDNQDIVSMGTNTALLTKKVIDNAFQVMSILFMALAQATDILQIKDKLAPATREAYCKVRELVAMINEDKPFNADLEKICTFLMNLGNE